MNNYKNKYIKYKLKYLKLKQTGGVCLGSWCFPPKHNVEDEEQEEKKTIIAKAVIYLEDLRQDEYDLSIEKKKNIMNSINKFLKNLKEKRNI